MLFTIWVDPSLGPRSLKTSHSSKPLGNKDDESSEEEGMEVYSGKEIRVHRYIETSHYSSINCVGC